MSLHQVQRVPSFKLLELPFADRVSSFRMVRELGLNIWRFDMDYHLDLSSVRSLLQKENRETHSLSQDAFKRR